MTIQLQAKNSFLQNFPLEPQYRFYGFYVPFLMDRVTFAALERVAAAASLKTAADHRSLFIFLSSFSLSRRRTNERPPTTIPQ